MQHNFARYIVFEASLQILKGEVKEMAWWNKGEPQEDAAFIESAKVVADSLADSDFVRDVELNTGKNLRDQISVEELEDMQKEANMRRWGPRRN
jgi:hypothetical protein